MEKKKNVTKSKLLEIQMAQMIEDQEAIIEHASKMYEVDVKLDKPKLDMSTVTQENILGLLAERATLSKRVEELSRKLMYAHIPNELSVEEFNFIVDKLNAAKIKEFKEVPAKLEAPELKEVV